MNAIRNLKWSALALSALLVAGSLGVAQGQGEASGADLFQQSYDDEALGKLEEALTALDRLPEARATGYVAVLRRAWLQYRLGRFATSVDSYKKAISLQPASVEAKVGILLPLMALKNWTGAAAAAREAQKLDPNNYLATLRLAFSLYSLGQYGEALMDYRKLADAYPSDVEVRGGLGWSLLKLGRAPEAATQFREVLGVAPRNSLALSGLAACGQ